MYEFYHGIVHCGRKWGERGGETYNCLNVEIGQAFFLTLEDPSQF